MGGGRTECIGFTQRPFSVKRMDVAGYSEIQYSKSCNCGSFMLLCTARVSVDRSPIDIFYNKLSWFVSELPEKDISNVVVQCRQYSTISCLDLCLNCPKIYLKRGSTPQFAATVCV